jgi:dGTPase
MTFDPHLMAYCALPLAHYACVPLQSKGRLYATEDSSFRSAFQRDRDRIIHCTAFRRLKYKTQVFIYDEGDQYRTRLSHTIEVSQIARTLARTLMLDEDLAEAVALAHDLGHTPFAHMGEDALKECMHPYGGFEHNDQSLRILVALERRYPEWNGLNLSWETLEGVVKHNGPITKDILPYTLSYFNKINDLQVHTHASLEAQAAAIADDIAYNSHDIEDGLRAGHFTLQDLESLSLIAPLLQKTHEKYPNLPQDLVIQALIRDLIGLLVGDVIDQSRQSIQHSHVKSVDDVRHAGKQLVDFSVTINTQLNELRAFLFKNMYYHYTLNRMRLKVHKIVTDLFETFMNHPETLPPEWHEKIKNPDLVHTQTPDEKTTQARVICDYIAGMTDRYALKEHQKLFELLSS